MINFDAFDDGYRRKSFAERRQDFTQLRTPEAMTDLDLLESVLIIMKGTEPVATFAKSYYAVGIAIDRLRKAYHSGKKKNMVLSFAAYFDKETDGERIGNGKVL